MDRHVSDGWVKKLGISLILIGVFFSVPQPLSGFMSKRANQRLRAVEGDSASRGIVSLSVEGNNGLSTAWKRFLDRYGKDSQVLGKADSQHIYRIIGGDLSLDIQRKGLITDGEMADACLDFIRKNQDILGVTIDEVRLLRSINKGGMSFVDFGQVFKGIPVYGSSIRFILSDTGKILSITFDHFPWINLSEYNGDPECAVRVAKSDLENIFPGSAFELSKKQLYVFPVQEQKETRFVWSWALELKNENPLQKWEYIVDAEACSILSKEDLGRYIISGKVRGQILPRYANDTPVEMFLPNIKVLCLRDDSPLLYNSLDSDPGWLGAAPFGWEFGQPMYITSCAGGPGPDKGHTGNTYYGYALNGCYPLNMWSPQYLTTSIPINCTGKKNIYLGFWRWLGVEGSDSDHASLEIADGIDSSWWKIWANPKKNIYDNGWRFLLYDISKWADGRANIFLRWGMGPTNGYVSYCGWNLDDIGVYTSTNAITNQEGSYQITGETTKNILSSCLEGTYFKVINDNGANVIYTRNNIPSGATERNLNFTRVTDYDVSTKMGTINALADIDEINAYYHANLLVRYIQEIDPEFLSELSDAFPISITVRYDTDYTNSFWLPGEGVFLGEGDKLEYGNFAHFADIIYHECSHAITDSIYDRLEGFSRGAGTVTSYAALNRFTEFDAMHEAFSDYWASTITNDSKIADGGFWVDHDCVRDLNNNLNYLINYGQELYQSSLILSGAMWDLRQELRKETGDEGIRVADTLIHFAQLAQPAKYIDFLVDCLIVDQVKYNSRYSALIKETFGKRGISQSPPPPASLVVNLQKQGATLIWSQSPEATGYYLYYGPNVTTRPLIADQGLRNILYMQDGGSSSSSSGGEMGDGGGGMDGGSSSSGQGTSTNSNTSSSGSNTSASGTSSNSNATINASKSKVDVGNSTTYYLAGLDPSVTYKVQVTAYNIYGVESIPSEGALIPGAAAATTTTSSGNTGDLTEGNWNPETSEVGLTKGVACFISVCGAARP